jgi:hypothetical protein
VGNPSDQKEASAGKEEEPTEAYQQGRKVVVTKSNDHTIKTCKTWAKFRESCGAQTLIIRTLWGLTVTDFTTRKQRGPGRSFLPGQSGNPAGRPKGSRNQLGEKFLKALADDFETHGGAAIVKVREERPHDYLKVIATILPKQLELETRKRRAEDFSDDELAAIVADEAAA